MHGFVKAKPFEIRQFDTCIPAKRHLTEIVIALKSYETRFGSRLNEIGENAERKADPGDYDRPAFDATMTINALFERGKLEDFIHGELARLFDFASDGNRPF